MANQTVPEQKADVWNSNAKQQCVQEVAQSMAILRAVRVAVDAVEDGSMSYEHDEVTRWGPVVGAATKRVCRVRDALISNGGAPSVDWFTPLTMMEALDAALWHGNTADADLQLTPGEVMGLTQAIIDELNALAQELQGCAA